MGLPRWLWSRDGKLPPTFPGSPIHNPNNGQSVCAQGNTLLRDVEKNNKICFPEISGASEELGTGVFSGLFLLSSTRDETKKHQLLPSDVE